LRFSLVHLASVWIALLAGAEIARANMVLESVTGEVTTNELASFIKAAEALPPPPSNNIGNTMVYEASGGARLHGLQTFYSFTKDQRALDVAIVWSDAFLHARNDPANGRIIWTGKRELCWPNKETNDEAHVQYSGTENGDVIEHIVNTAKLILESPSLWNQTAPADKFNFGATYLDRAKTYVRECQASAETTIVPWYVRSTKDGCRLIHPDSPVYYKYCESSGPVPWNQQQFIVGGLLRLAQCHRLLNDGSTNIAYYEKITGDAADWFFSNCRLVSSRGRVGYDWSYVSGWDIADEPEDTGHSFYDVYVSRACQANLGPTPLQMQRLINTARFVMYLGTNRFSGMVNGTSNERRYERKYLNYQWIELSALDRRLYDLLGSAVLTSHEYWEDIPVEAAVLQAKHHWATTPATPEILEDAKRVPPVPSPSAERMRAAIIIALLWGLSEFLLMCFKRSKSNTVSRDRHSLRLIWLVNATAVPLSIAATYALRRCELPWPRIGLGIGCGLFAAGLALRWYSIRQLGRFFTTNVAIAADHRVIDSGPYRFIRHPSYAGGLLAVLGFGLSLQNWASLLILFVPFWCVTLWRIHIEEQALTSALGRVYTDYMNRTKRLLPLLY
jgi:protein-S-isoprenylcysteine O-methyltransferase Ste14